MIFNRFSVCCVLLNHLSVFVFTLHKDIFKEVVIVLLHLLISHIGQMGAVCSLGRVLRVDVEVREEHRLGEGWLVVNPAASVTVSTSTCNTSEL